MLLRLVRLSQLAQCQSQRVMRGAVSWEQFYSFSEMRGGGGKFPASGLDPTQAVMRLRDGGVFLDDSFVKRPALEPLTGGQQRIREAESRRKIIGTQAHGLFENNRRFDVFAQCGLNNPEVIDPTNFIQRQPPRAFIADGGALVFFVGVQRHAESPDRLGVARTRLGRGVGFARLVTNFRPEVFKRDRRQVRQSLSLRRRSYRKNETNKKREASERKSPFSLIRRFRL